MEDRENRLGRTLDRLLGLVLGALLVVAAMAAAASLALMVFVAWEMALRPAHAHEAPSGWSYDAACCSGHDCAMVRPSAIHEGPNGITITLKAGEHPMLIGPFTAFVGNDSRKLKESPDGEWHVCMGRQWRMRDGNFSDGAIYCVYRPIRGM